MSGKSAVNWARARNGVVQGGGTTPVQGYITATRALADVAATETGGDPDDITAALMADGGHQPR